MNKQLVDKVFQSKAGLAGITLRLPVGIVLAAHGAQKLFGWFGGYGLEGTGQWMASIGLEPGYLMALLAGGIEFFGGLALVFGLLTRPAAALSALTMLVAIFSVHIGNGLFISTSGYEFALTLFAATLALAIQGGGSFAIDSWLRERIGSGASA